MPDQYPSLGLADLRDTMVGLSIAWSFGLRNASQINTPRLGLRIGSLRAFELFGGRGPRQVVNRRNVSGGRLLHPPRGCGESRVRYRYLFDTSQVQSITATRDARLL